MKQKFLYLFLTTLLSLIGGGKLWADQVTFNTTSGNLTTPQDEISLSWAGDGSDLQSDNLKIPKGSTLTISTSSRFIQSIEMTLKSGQVYATQYVTANVGSTAYDDTNKKYTWTGIAKSIVFTNANESGARDFRPVSIVVTYTTTDPSTVNDATVQTYPYTWDFSSTASLWTSSIEQLAVFTNEWNHITEDSKDEYRPKVERSNWGYNIDIVKGLKFSTASVGGSPCLDYKNQQLWVADNTTITIPEVKAGQIVKITGTVTVSSTSSNLTTKTASSEYTVTSDGDVTLTFNSSWIKTLAVLKTAITRFNFKGGGANTTTYDYDSNNPAFSPVLIIEPSGAASDNSLFTVTNSTDTEVIAIANSGCSSITSTDNINFGNSLRRGKPGTSTVTFSFAGNDAYEPKTFTATYTINKLTPTVTFAEGTAPKMLAYSTDTYTNAATATNGKTVTYTSSKESVATVSGGGVVTFVNSGVTTITASVEGDEYYNAASASYTLTVNGSVNPTITMSKSGTNVTEGEEVETMYGSSITVTGTSSAGLTVKYRSADASIATVDASGKITTKNGGTVRIYVYTEGSGNINPAETYYNLKINAANFVFHFLPTSGKVNQGKNITPHTNFPTIYAEDLTSITAESSNTGVATVPTTLWDKNNPSYDYLRYHIEEATGKHIIDGLKPTITGVAEGTATISINFVSAQYSTSSPATYSVTVTPSTGLNFDWASKDELTMYEGDYMMMPAITGNANGYPFEQNDAQRYVWSMKQNDTNVYNLSWYNTNYHPGEGEPFYWLTDGGRPDNDKLAYILYAQSNETRSGTYPEGLMIYARKAGTVQIHAKDLQLDEELSTTITLTILPKANIYSTETDSEGELILEQKSISYPYTWDFTKDFSGTEFDANSYYWTQVSGGYTNGLALQNSDYADDNHDGNNAGSQRLYKALLANHHTIPAFKGLMVQLGGTYFNSKYERITVKPSAGDGNSHLRVTGGPQYFKLPTPGTGTEPNKYRVYLKAIPYTAGRGEIRLVVDGTTYGYENSKGQFHDNGIYYADVNAGQEVEVAIQDCDVYWMAMSTEANNTAKPGVNSTLTYAATSYSYGKALDLAKSEEVNNGLTAYYAKSFTNGQDAASAVTLHQVTLDQKRVPANTGLVLKSDNPSTNYMIADAENQDSYSEPTALGTNYLVAGDGSVVNSTTGSDDNIKTNFILSYAYKKFADDGTTAMTGYQYNRDWSFYKVMPSATVPVGKAYLQVDGNLRVKSDGTIETITPSGSRRAADGSDDDRPANKLMLDIVYEDEAHGFDATTAINDVKTDTVTVDDDAWYTLQGVRVNAPARGGIYIHNGRKVVIK